MSCDQPHPGRLTSYSTRIPVKTHPSQSVKMDGENIENLNLEKTSTFGEYPSNIQRPTFKGGRGGGGRLPLLTRTGPRDALGWQSNIFADGKTIHMCELRVHETAWILLIRHHTPTWT